VRLETKPDAEPNLEYAAFQNPDGSFAFVIVNEDTNEKEITLTDGVKTMDYNVPARAVMSWRWKD
jgi:glucosylceramidase